MEKIREKAKQKESWIEVRKETLGLRLLGKHDKGEKTHYKRANNHLLRFISIEYKAVTKKIPRS